MGNLDPVAGAQAWSTRLGQSGDKITKGINAVTVAPGVAAAKQSAVWAQNVAAATAKYQKNVAAVSLQSWQNAAITKGVPRVATGAAAAVDKMTAFNQAFYPAVAAAQASLPPRGTYEQNKARANQMMDKLHGFSYTPSS